MERISDIPGKSVTPEGHTNCRHKHYSSLLQGIVLFLLLQSLFCCIWRYICSCLLSVSFYRLFIHPFSICLYLALCLRSVCWFVCLPVYSSSLLSDRPFLAVLLFFTGFLLCVFFKYSSVFLSNPLSCFTYRRMH